MAIPIAGGFTVGDIFAHGSKNYEIKGADFNGLPVFSPLSEKEIGIGDFDDMIASTVEQVWLVRGEPLGVGDNPNNQLWVKDAVGNWGPNGLGGSGDISGLGTGTYADMFADTSKYMWRVDGESAAADGQVFVKDSLRNWGPIEVAASASDPSVGTGDYAEMLASTTEYLWRVDGENATADGEIFVKDSAGNWGPIEVSSSSGTERVGKGDTTAMLASTDPYLWVVEGQVTTPPNNGDVYVKDDLGNWGPLAGTGSTSPADALTQDQVDDILLSTEMTMAEKIAGEAISQHAVVAVDDAFNVVNANNLDDTQFGQVLGVAMFAAASGAPIDIQLTGEMEFSGWSWSPGNIWFNSNGDLTQTAPSTGFDQVVAVAQSATKIVIQVREPVDLI